MKAVSYIVLEDAEVMTDLAKWINKTFDHLFIKYLYPNQANELTMDIQSTDDESILCHVSFFIDEEGEGEQIRMTKLGLDPINFESYKDSSKWPIQKWIINNL